VAWKLGILKAALPWSYALPESNSKDIKGKAVGSDEASWTTRLELVSPSAILPASSPAPGSKDGSTECSSRLWLRSLAQ